MIITFSPHHTSLGYFFAWLLKHWFGRLHRGRQLPFPKAITVFCNIFEFGLQLLVWHSLLVQTLRNIPCSLFVGVHTAWSAPIVRPFFNQPVLLLRLWYNLQCRASKCQLCCRRMKCLHMIWWSILIVQAHMVRSLVSTWPIVIQTVAGRNGGLTKVVTVSCRLLVDYSPLS